MQVLIDMNKKHLYNPIIAAGYIAIIISIINWIGNMQNPPEENIFMPIAMLSLLVFSVASMGYLFFFEPLVLLIDHKSTEAKKLFLTSIAIFAVFIVFFSVLALFIIP